MPWWCLGHAVALSLVESLVGSVVSASEARTAYAEGVEQLATEVSEVAGRRVAVVGELDPPFEGDPAL